MKKIAREQTKKILVKNIQIGNQNKVVIQSMTNTKTSNIEKTLDQINRLCKEGAELVRVAVLDDEDANSLKEIVKLAKCPIIADIHFNYEFALKAIKNGVAKIRINPGNIGNEENLKEIIKAANEKNVAIRIGVNSGSLPKDLFNKYGVSANCMLKAALRFIKFFEENNFFNIVVSLKATDPLLTIKAYELASKKIKYPLHIGITEAGSIFNGTIKSCAGLSVLLYKGIGDTIRISLTGDPIVEIKVVKKLLNSLNLYKNIVDVIACPTCGRLNFDLEKTVKEIEEYCKEIQMPLKIAILGCAVNGPGEAKEADIGIAGGNKSGIIFEHGKIIKTVKQENLVNELKQMIDIKHQEYLKNKRNEND